MFVSMEARQIEANVQKFDNVGNYVEELYFSRDFCHIIDKTMGYGYWKISGIMWIRITIIQHNQEEERKSCHHNTMFSAITILGLIK